MKARDKGETPAATYSNETEAEVQRLFAAAGNSARDSGLIDSADEWSVAATTIDKASDSGCKYQCRCDACEKSRQQRRQLEQETAIPAATASAAVNGSRYDDDDRHAFVLLGQARAIVAELTSPYWNHESQRRARAWLREYDEREAGNSGSKEERQ